MKALYYPSWGKLEVKEVPEPILADGEVLVRVSECGICGSELETFRTHNIRRTPPLIMGHEFCGRIEALRNSSSDWSRGDRVIAHALIHCGLCPACLRGDTNLCRNRQLFGMSRPGGFGEYVAVPERVLISWPEGVGGKVAVLAEPLANGINAMRQGQSLRKSRVVVIGAGPIGLMCLWAAKRIYNSTVVVSDMVPERLSAARMLGADLTVNVRQVDLERELQAYWPGGQAEFVIDAVGSQASKELSIRLVEPGGTAVWLGLHEQMIQLDSYRLTLDQKSVSGSYSGSFEDFKLASQLLSTGALDTSWTKLYKLDDGEIGFRDMLAGRGSNIKGILRLDGQDSNL